MGSSSDGYAKDEQGKREIEHSNLCEEWKEKIRRIGNGSLSNVREYIEIDLIEEKNKDFFWGFFSLRRVNAIEKKTYRFKYYRKYTIKQVEKLSDVIIEERFTTKAAALTTRTDVRTAQTCVKTYNNDPERQLPGFYSKPCGRPRNKLTEEHSRFLVDYIEKNTTAISVELKLKLCEKFEGLKISISAVNDLLFLLFTQQSTSIMSLFLNSAYLS
ncbi:hypothetical protein BY458DRAFT_487476 [Sporodiniella umbellata]|nr:hypothetical protein BY458DRAFT_487476 [Sporodiniella umbellata]